MPEGIVPLWSRMKVSMLSAFGHQPRPAIVTVSLRVGQVDQHRRHAGELDLVAVHDAERDAARHAGVDGVAAGPQDRVRRLGREILPGRCHVVMADDHWLHPHQALPRPLRSAARSYMIRARDTSRPNETPFR